MQLQFEALINKDLVGREGEGHPACILNESNK